MGKKKKKESVLHSQMSKKKTHLITNWAVDKFNLSLHGETWKTNYPKSSWKEAEFISKTILQLSEE